MPHLERSPPRIAAKVVYLTFDWDSRKSDYRSFVEEYQDRKSSAGLRLAKLWAYKCAANALWETIPPDIRSAVFAFVVRLLLRN